MGWEDCPDKGHGHIHFTDKSTEDSKESVSIPQPPQSLNQGGAKQLHVAPKRHKHVYSAVHSVAKISAPLRLEQPSALLAGLPKQVTGQELGEAGDVDGARGSDSPTDGCTALLDSALHGL